MWIARTVSVDPEEGKGRQLPGIRSVKAWREDQQLTPFGFSSASYERYRFIGPYGAYRVGLRSLGDLTIAGDGWRLGKLGEELAEIAAVHAGAMESHARGKGKRPHPDRYWLKRFEWKTGNPEFLPTSLSEPTALPSKEAGLLRRALFDPKHASERVAGQAARRKAVVRLAADSGASELGNVCRAISKELVRDAPLLESLPAFCFLSEAGVAAMNTVWNLVKTGSPSAGFPLRDDVVADPELVEAFRGLTTASARWLKESRKFTRQQSVPSALASAVSEAGGDNRRVLTALVKHHQQYGGGLRWVAISEGRVVPLAPLKGGRTRDYRFRLQALSRMAVQCRVIGSMPKVYAVAESDEAAQ